MIDRFPHGCRNEAEWVAVQAMMGSGLPVDYAKVIDEETGETRAFMRMQRGKVTIIRPDEQNDSYWGLWGGMAGVIQRTVPG